MSGDDLARPVRLQPLARGKVSTLGEPGRAWVADLPRVLDGLAHRWGLVLGAGLPGGSASYVCAATTDAGEPRVLKVVMPDPRLAAEAPALAAAAGRGHVWLHDHDDEHRALLLERLGPSLELGPAAVEDRLDLAVDVLLEAWAVPLAEVVPGPPSQDLAADLAASVQRAATAHPDACAPAALRSALDCAARRSGARDPARDVLVHGDAHPGNLLRVLAPRPGAATGYVLVDPDGLRGEQEYDAGVLLRDWSARLAGPEPGVLLAAYCRRVAERADLDLEAVWDWAYLERVSTGLYLTTLGADRLARRFLDSAAALVPRTGRHSAG